MHPKAAWEVTRFDPAICSKFGSTASQKPVRKPLENRRWINPVWTGVFGGPKTVSRLKMNRTQEATRLTDRK